jgi:hypothetical protein
MRFWRENREKNLSMHPWAKQAGLTQYCVLEQGEGYSGQAQFSACHAEPTPESRIGAGYANRAAGRSSRYAHCYNEEQTWWFPIRRSFLQED